MTPGLYNGIYLVTAINGNTVSYTTTSFNIGAPLSWATCPRRPLATHTRSGNLFEHSMGPRSVL